MFGLSFSEFFPDVFGLCYSDHLLMLAPYVKVLQPQKLPKVASKQLVINIEILRRSKVDMLVILKKNGTTKTLKEVWRNLTAPLTCLSYTINKQSPNQECSAARQVFKYQEAHTTKSKTALF